MRDLGIAVAASVTIALLSCATSEPPRAAPTVMPATDAKPVADGTDAASSTPNPEACTDFDAFANGDWQAKNPIPASKKKWGRLHVAIDGNKHRIQDLLGELSAKPDWPAGSAEQLAGDHFASCMDQVRIDAAGLTSLAPLLTGLDRIRTLADVERMVRRLHELGIHALFGASSNYDYQKPANTILNVTAGSLGLPGRDYYVKSEPHFEEARAKYREHIVALLELGGVPEDAASKASGEVLALEKRLAEVSLDTDTAADAAATDHKVSFVELERAAPHFDWDKYFAEAHLPRGDLSINEPKYLHQLDEELTATSIATWKAYLIFQLLDSASPWLSRPFALESFHFKDKFLGGAVEMKPRSQACAESTDALFDDALAKKYAERYLPPRARAKVQEIIRNELAVLTAEVADVKWMGQETKKTALEKLATYDAEVGYPDKWKDYSGVTVRRDAFWANVAAGRKLAVDTDRKRVGKATDRGLWLTTPSSLDAYIRFELNQIVLPAGFLQSPVYSLDANDAVNYGAIGAGVAHDITHALDVSGSDYDVTGRPQNWWSAADREEFKKRAQCVFDQFEGYFIEPGIHHQGKLVQSESIADLAGVKIAYLALKKSMETHPVPVVDGLTPEQQFFLSYGHFRGAAMRAEAQRQMVASDIHPVARFRVIGPLSNLPEFQQAFSCRAGAEMVRPKEKRCSVW
jgi:putative endopeptidase